MNLVPGLVRFVLIEVFGVTCRLEEHLGSPPGDSEALLEPDCVLTFDLPFSMMAYEHLEVHSSFTLAQGIKNWPIIVFFYCKIESLILTQISSCFLDISLWKYINYWTYRPASYDCYSRVCGHETTWQPVQRRSCQLLGVRGMSPYGATGLPLVWPRMIPLGFCTLWLHSTGGSGQSHTRQWSVFAGHFILLRGKLSHLSDLDFIFVSHDKI